MVAGVPTRCDVRAWASWQGFTSAAHVSCTAAGQDHAGVHSTPVPALGRLASLSLPWIRVTTELHDWALSLPTLANQALRHF